MTILFWVWLGGLASAYSMNRSGGMGRISSSFDALCWPFEMGQYLVRNFYQNDGWKK